VFAIITVFLASFFVALSGALMPGPLLMVTISESPRRGFMAGPLLIVGHSILEGIFVLSILLGLSPFLKGFVLFELIAILGAGMLLYMARGMLKGLPYLSLTSGNRRSPPRSLVLKGAIVSLANPYWSLWWVTVGLSYILWSMKYGFWGWVSFFFGHISADFLWYSAISLTVSRGVKILTDKIYRRIVFLCALFLVAFAFYFLYAATSNLYRFFTEGV